MNFEQLPEILMPEGLPAWLVNGFDGTDDSAYGRVPMSTGHDRKRRVFRRPPITRNVSLMLTELQTMVFEGWFENDLLAGERLFSARVRDMGPGHIWYSAQFTGPYTAAFQHWAKGVGKSYWLVSAELRLYGVGSDFGPELTPFKSLATVALLGRATAPAPVSLKSTASAALTGGFANVTFSSAVTVMLDGAVSAEGLIALQSSVTIDLRATAAPTRTTLFKSAVEVHLT